jgi:predicted transcriptional regulator
MTKDVTLSLRISGRLSDKLEKHAKRLKRSKSSLAEIAIENYMEIEAQELALTKAALARAKAGGPFIAHEDMIRWMDSLGTPNELPLPPAKIRF